MYNGADVNGAVVFGLSQFLKNLVVEAKLQCKRTSNIIIQVPQR